MAAPEPTPGQAYIRWRTERRERHVPVTIDGHTEMATEHYDVQVPVPPRDWDSIVLNAVSIITAALVTVAIIWSTASIGGLLAITVTDVIAYAAAVVFDLVWVTCMAVEWLCRYDRDRAKAASLVGYAALGISMLAVTVHGYRAGALEIGLIGAMVSALAKGMFTIVLRYHARPLDDRTRQWLVAREASLNAQLALAARRRQHARVEGQHAALLAATGTQQPSAPADPGSPDQSGQQARAAATIRSAVRAAADTMPDATDADIAQELARHGIDVDPEQVRDILGPREQAPADDDVVRPIRTGSGPTVLDSVRDAVGSGIRDLPGVLRIVRQIHGDRVREDTVSRYLRSEIRSADRGRSA